MCAKAYDSKTAAFIGFLIQNVPTGLDDQTMQGWMDNPAATKRLLAGLKAPEEKSKEVLNFKEHLIVAPPATPLDLKAFFKHGWGGFWFPDDFHSRAQALLVEVAPMEVFALKSFDLGQNANDRQIKAALPENHEVELWVIAQMIATQKGGKRGPLLTNGYANIFYVGDLVVGVVWGLGGEQWSVRCDVAKASGYRVFSRS